MPVQYEPNEKHKRPWQPGRKGSLCPSDLTVEQRDKLLADSAGDPHGTEKRFATDGRLAFCAQPHGPGRYHGYPVGWKEVPEQLRRQWIKDGKTTRKAIYARWESE